MNAAHPDERGVRLLSWLRSLDYGFTTPTPATHRIVLRRRPPSPISLTDILGWNRPFQRDDLPEAWRHELEAAGVVVRRGEAWAATCRVASLGPDLFLHSAFPPSDEDAVFFGPDTYRFARFLQAELSSRAPIGTAVDLGAGSGAGAVTVARSAPVDRLLVLDVSPRALATAATNLAAAGLSAEVRLGDGLEVLREEVDLIVANPPYIAGDGDRIYRDGGDLHGARLSLDWALDGARRLRRGGRFLLYTGSAIVRGADPLHQALRSGLDGGVYDLRYEELDPDVFGAQLRDPAYRDVDRIAAVGAVITRRL